MVDESRSNRRQRSQNWVKQTQNIQKSRPGKKYHRDN